RPRLPGAQPEFLRRPRQLCHGHQGTYHFPRDLVRPDRAGLGHGRDHLHDRQERRRGAGAAQGIQLPLPAVSEGEKEDDMAKTSAIEKNKRRTKLVKQYGAKRAKLKALSKDQSVSMEERFGAQLKLAALPRNSSPGRVRNRCEFSGRPRGFYRKFKLSRIALRELGNLGEIPGLVKSSW